jgi:hypothetical protein
MPWGENIEEPDRRSRKVHMILPNCVGQAIRGQGCLPKRFGPKRNLQDSFVSSKRVEGDSRYFALMHAVR